MQVVMQREALSEAVTRLSRAVSAKTSIPVLEGILLSAEPGQVTLAAYNLELCMTKVLEARVEEAGDIVISARLFGEILRRMNSDQVRIEVDDRMMCHLSGGSAVFDLSGMAAADFPEMPSMPENTTIELPGDLLKSIVRQTNFAVAPTEGTRPILTGANFVIENGELRVIAVDGFRLAIRKEQVSSPTPLNIVVAGRAIGEAVRLIDDSDRPVTIQVGARHIGFFIDGYRLISRLLDGEFLDYKRTIPAASRQEMRLNTGRMIEVLERISLMIVDSFSTPIRCIVDENRMVMSCATAVGRATETVEVEMTGKNFEIGLNSRYLLEALRAAETDEVIAQFNDGTGPVVLRPVQGDGFLYLIMPMRLKG